MRPSQLPSNADEVDRQSQGATSAGQAAFSPQNGEQTEAPPQPPGLGNAARALWLLTWKNQVNYRRLPMIAVLLLLVPLLFGFTVDRGSPVLLLHWTVNLYLFLFVPLFCLGQCGAMIRDELQADTLRFLVTRPISRARLFVLRFCCQWLWLQIVGLIGLGLIGIAGLIRNVDTIVTLFPWLIATQAAALTAYGALSALFGLLTRRYLVVGVVYGLIVEVGIGRTPTNLNTLSVSHHLRGLLAHHPLVQHTYDWTPESIWRTTIALGIASIVPLLAAAIVFHFKEFLPKQGA